jgi:hypothetical protein
MTDNEVERDTEREKFYLTTVLIEKAVELLW